MPESDQNKSDPTKEPAFQEEYYIGQYFEKVVKRFLETPPQPRKAKPKPKRKPKKPKSE
ncbi:MAG: hypothetical protein IH999_10880 [Proteobacteria bacterium]|nr:hypothetical protein [Pseudomonadota bacterium]